MKSTFVLVLIASAALLFASSSGFAKVSPAPATKLTCVSPNALADAVLTFTAGDLQEVYIGNDAMWAHDISKFDRADLTDVTALVSGSQFLKSLVAITGAKPGEFAKVELVAITAKPVATAPKATVERQLEILGDDAAGIAYVVLTDAKGGPVASAVMIGWAGFFNSCK